MPFRATLFDLDGTLLDTLADISRSANEALAMEGLPARTEAEFRRFIGDGIATTFRRALPPDQADDARVARCVEHFQTTYGQGWKVETRPFDGIPELLDALTERKIAMGIVSNKADHFTHVIGEAFLARWPFRAIIGHRPGMAKKPDPGSALEVAATLGIDPADCVFVGDSGVDMKTGRAAGMFPVGVAWGFQTIELLLEGGAGAIIEKPEELLGILDRR